MIPMSGHPGARPRTVREPVAVECPTRLESVCAQSEYTRPEDSYQSKDEKPLSTYINVFKSLDFLFSYLISK